VSDWSDSDKIFPLDHINGFTPRTLRDFALRLRFESVQRPVAQVNCEFARVLKTEARRMLQRFLPRTAQLNFRKSVLGDRGMPGAADAAVYGVSGPGTEGRAGMAALVVGEDFDLGEARAGRAPARLRQAPSMWRCTPV
jgi:hypothetical protein